MLYLVATPIGNLGDMSERAVQTLRDVDWIAAEDTRKTGRLLKHLKISTPQMSFYEHNEDTAGGRIMNLLEQGASVALVTTAGTPGIADPGFTLVRAAIAQGIECTMIPGASAHTMALVLSGLPVHSFTFRGFLPRKAGARRRCFEQDATSPYTLIYYESPHRIQKAVADALDLFGDRPAALCNDLTKLYEHVERGTLSELLAYLDKARVQGEYVLCIGGAELVAKQNKASAS